MTARCGANKEEIEKVDDLCAFRGVAQLGLGVPFFLSPPWSHGAKAPI